MRAHERRCAVTPADEGADRAWRRERLLLLKRLEAVQREKTVSGTPEGGREGDASNGDASCDSNAGVRHAEEEQRRVRHLERSLGWPPALVGVPQAGEFRRGVDRGPEL